MTAIVYLDQQIRAACPNATGVSIGRWDDKTTWKVLGPVTPTESATAQGMFDAFTLSTYVPTPVVTLEDKVTALQATVSALSVKTGVAIVQPIATSDAIGA